MRARTPSASSSLEPLLNPQSIALIGASPTSRVGRAILENLLHLGYAGNICPVNPKYGEVLGLPCYPSVREIPGPVDAVMIATSSGRVLPLLEECGEKGVRAAVVTADGFAESGPEGRVLQDQLVTTARQFNIAVCGPNCMGIMNTATGGSLYTGALNRSLPPGDVSAVLQSGSAGIALMNNHRGLNFRYVISSGNEAVITTADYVHYLGNDPGTRVIALVIEGVRDGDRLLSGIELAHRRGKPVVLLRLGSSLAGQEMVLAHTGALAGSVEVTEAICRQFGILQVRNLEELFSTCLLLSRHDLPGSSRAGAITLSGGYATLSADLGASVGVSFPDWAPETARALSTLLPEGRTPRNPFDAWGTGDFRTSLRESITATLSDHATDFLIIWQDLPPDDAPNGTDVPQTLLDMLYETAPAPKPVVIMGALIDPPTNAYRAKLAEAGATYLQDAELGMRALAHWSSARERMGRSAGRTTASRSASSHPLDLSVQGLLSRGIPLARQRLTHSPAEAREAADALGYPVVLKVQSPDLPHKSDVGAVALNVDRPAVEETYQRLIDKMAATAPHGRIEGLLVQEQARPGLEFIVGATLEPDWGWVVMVGLGGLFVETLRDVTFRRVPLRHSDAETMLAELRSYPFLLGVRGGPARDVDALVGLLTEVSALVEGHSEELSQIEFNPVVLHGQGEGLVIVDMLVASRG